MQKDKKSQSSSIVSHRSSLIEPFIAMDILEEIKALQEKGKDIISFSIGEPDFPTPAAIKIATQQAVDEDFTFYTHSLGLKQLRDAIVQHYQKRYGVTLSPEQVLVTSGTSPAMLLCFGALLDPGDEVILSNPCYPCYPNFIKFLGGKNIYVNVYEEEAFAYRPKDVAKKITAKTKAILVNSPSNPTGCLVPKETLASLAKLGKYIVSDEIYHGLSYEKKEHSILEFTDQAFVLNGFSKAYAMTGFRLGYLIAPKEFMKPLQNMQQSFFISASSLAQKAGIAALTQCSAELKAMKASLNERRLIMLEGLKKLGFRITVNPSSAFYIFANIKHFSQDSFAFAWDLLHEAGVGITPGVDFGSQGEGYVRFSYICEPQRIKEGLERIKAFLKSKKLI